MKRLLDGAIDLIIIKPMFATMAVVWGVLGAAALYWCIPFIWLDKRFTLAWEEQRKFVAVLWLAMIIGTFIAQMILLFYFTRWIEAHKPEWWDH